MPDASVPHTFVTTSVMADSGAAAAANESHLPAEPGEAGVQLPSAEEERRRECHHQIATEAEAQSVSSRGASSAVNGKRICEW